MSDCRMCVTGLLEGRTTLVVEQGKGVRGGRPPKNGVELTLLDSAARTAIDAEPQNGLCLQRFREDVTYAADRASGMDVGATLRIGTAAIIIEKKGKRCFAECALSQGGDDCPLRDNVLFARIAKDGDIKIGDEIREI